MLKSKPVLAFALIAAALYATILLYNSGTVNEYAKKIKPTPVDETYPSPAAVSHPHAPPPSPPASVVPAPPASPSEPPSPSSSASASHSQSLASLVSAAAPSSTPDFAIATFLTGQASDDTYFNATRFLAYQLLHAPSTRLKNPNITFLVLCGRQLTEEKKDRLRKDGAMVIELEDVELPSWIHTSNERWSEQFTKLRVFERTEFQRILYIDADYMIMQPMDGIFDEPEIKDLSPTQFSRDDKIKEDEGPLPEKWLFAARPEMGAQNGFNHHVPPFQGDYANAGFFMIHPDKEMYNHFMAVMQHEGRFDPLFMEQNMLNYVFKRDGPMPWRELNWKWSANFVNQADVEFGVHSLHGKFWQEGPQEVQDRWRSTMDEMLAYWEKN